MELGRVFSGIFYLVVGGELVKHMNTDLGVLVVGASCRFPIALILAPVPLVW